MCGIFALFVNEKKCPDKSIVEKSFNKLKQRGPDNSNLYHKVVKSTIAGKSKDLQPVDQNHFIGFHRLAINGLDSNSNQPFIQDDIVLICNGEIYNHALLSKDYSFEMKTKSDCEVIIHMYRR